MLKLPLWRVIMVAIVSVFGLVFAAPNFVPQNVRSSLPGFLQQTLNLGLDLRGGVHLMYEVDTAALRHQQLESLTDQMVAAFREAEPAIRIGGRGVVGDAARVRILDPADMERARRVLRPLSRSPSDASVEAVTFTEGADGAIEARLTPRYINEISRDAVQRSIPIIARRIDPSGAGEITPVRQGDNRIVIQAPGLSDPQELKDRIGQTALMTFHMVRELDPAEAAAGRIPPGSMIVQPYPGFAQNAEVVERRPRFTGERLADARVGSDSQSGGIVMTFRLDNRGARLFCTISSQNVGKRFAILLDNQVLTAPNIEEPICGGSGQIRGSFTTKEASDLALMLRAGALPAPLNIVEERSVGSELGQDAIDAGVKAGIVASVLVIAFMLLAYGMFGLLACLALVINIAMIVATMSLSGATLSLPGIAGLVLTIGMAVDANVLIYERMREEAALGRGPAMAIDAGFSRALVTIIDSHVTQIGVALILFWFGHGPVRGFAWTLSIGVVTSVITATVVTQYFIAIWFRLVRPRQLPI